MLAVQKIYIAHYLPLFERKQNILNQLNTHSLNAEWVVDEPDDSSIAIISNTDMWDIKFSEMQNKNYCPKRQLRKSEISLEYKHIKIYENIIKNDIKSALVLEDDVILDKNFSNNFNLFLSMTPKDWDMIFIGSGCDLTVPPSERKSGVIAYKKDHPASKCTDSYIIKKSAAQKIINTILPFTFPIDFELNYQMFKHNMNVYWWEPSIVKQGSQCGLYRSEIQ